MNINELRYYSNKLRDENLMKALMDKYPDIHFFKAVEPFNNAYYANISLVNTIKAILKSGSEDDIDMLAAELHLTHGQLKSIKHEFIVYGRKFADVATIGHELGHHYHTTKGNFATKNAHKLYNLDVIRPIVTIANLGLLVKWGKKILPLNLVSQLGLSAPQLTAEGAASNYSLKLLKNELQLDEENIKLAKKDLRGAFSTYLVYHIARNIFPIVMNVGVANSTGANKSDLTIKRTDSESTKLVKKIALKRRLEDNQSIYKFKKR